MQINGFKSYFIIAFHFAKLVSGILVTCTQINNKTRIRYVLKGCHCIVVVQLETSRIENTAGELRSLKYIYATHLRYKIYKYQITVSVTAELAKTFDVVKIYSQSIVFLVL